MPWDPKKEMAERELKDKALRAAAERDQAKGYAVLQMSPRRYAVVHVTLGSWTTLNPNDRPDPTDPAAYLTNFTASFVLDAALDPLNNLTWEQAQEWYRKLMTQGE